MTQDRLGSLIFLIIGIYGLVGSSQLPMGKLYEPGPGLFPLLLSFLLTLSGAMIWASGKGGSPLKWERKGGSLMKPSLIILLTAGFILLLKPAGFFTASLLYLWCLFFLVSRFSIWVAMVLSGSLAMGSLFFLGHILAIPLPRGPWGI